MHLNLCLSTTLSTPSIYLFFYFYGNPPIPMNDSPYFSYKKSFAGTWSLYEFIWHLSLFEMNTMINTCSFQFLVVVFWGLNYTFGQFGSQLTWGTEQVYRIKNFLMHMVETIQGHLCFHSDSLHCEILLPLGHLPLYHVVSTYVSLDCVQ